MVIRFYSLLEPFNIFDVVFWYVGQGYIILGLPEKSMYVSKPKSLYRSHHFYETEYQIWANFWLVGNTDKKIEAVKYAIFEAVFFNFLWAKKNMSASCLLKLQLSALYMKDINEEFLQF